MQHEDSGVWTYMSYSYFKLKTRWMYVGLLFAELTMQQISVTGILVLENLVLGLKFSNENNGLPLVLAASRTIIFK